MGKKHRLRFTWERPVQIITTVYVDESDICFNSNAELLAALNRKLLGLPLWVQLINEKRHESTFRKLGADADNRAVLLSVDVNEVDTIPPLVDEE